MTTASPAATAALRFGGLPVTAAATARLRETLATQRQGNSESFVRNWDSVAGEVVRVSASWDRPQPTYTQLQRKRRAEAALLALPARKLACASEGNPCAICHEALAEGDAVRRLPCAHVFHADCIAKWLHVKLTCPLDNLPVDDSLEMLAGAGAETVASPAVVGTESTSHGDMDIEEAAAPLPEHHLAGMEVVSGAEAPPPPPTSEPPPTPPPPLEPGQRGGARPSTGTVRSTSACVAATASAISAAACPTLPPVGLRELQEAAASAGVSVERMADALAERRSQHLRQHQLELERLAQGDPNTSLPLFVE